MGGGCCIDWNKAKVPSVGCCLFLAGSVSLHHLGQVLGMALWGHGEGAGGAVWVPFRDIPCMVVQAGRKEPNPGPGSACVQSLRCRRCPVALPRAGLALGGVGVSLGAQHLQCPCAGHRDLSTELIFCWQE